MKAYHEAGVFLSTLLHDKVCPALSSVQNVSLDEAFFFSNNRPVLDLIHALSVANAYHPKKFNNYSWKKYFLVCLIASGPSWTLRSLVMGEPWSFVGSPTAIPCLLLAMTIAGLLGGLPGPVGQLVSTWNAMSSVVSVQGGVRILQSTPKVTPMASWLLGIANGSGGAVWNVLVQAWFGHGQYKWETLDRLIPSWILLSTTWNIFFWSNCTVNANTLALIEYALFLIIVLDSTVLRKLESLATQPKTARPLPPKPNIPPRPPTSSISSFNSSHSIVEEYSHPVGKQKKD
jgi:hypothetical protein